MCLHIVEKLVRVWWNGIHYRLKICRLQGIEGSSPSTRTKCASGGMVYMLVLEASAERIVSSSLTWRTNVFEAISPGYFLARALGPAILASPFYGAFVYRLGQLVFIQPRGVRFSYALPSCQGTLTLNRG